MSYTRKKRYSRYVTVSVRLSKKVWSPFKELCWKEGMYIREAVEQALIEFLKKTQERKR